MATKDWKKTRKNYWIKQSEMSSRKYNLWIKKIKDKWRVVVDLPNSGYVLAERNFKKYVTANKFAKAYMRKH